jgi:hypothetical protein
VPLPHDLTARFIIGTSSPLVVDAVPAVDIGPADCFMLDGVTWSWSFPDGVWPAQPEPLELKCSLVSPTPLDYLDVGTPVRAWLRFTTGPDADPVVVVDFPGRLTDVEATAIDYAVYDGADVVPMTGIRYDLTAVDLTVDLAELYLIEGIELGLPGGGTQGAALRLDQLFGNTLGHPLYGDDGLPGLVYCGGFLVGDLFQGQTYSRAPLRDAALDILRQAPASSVLPARAYGVLSPIVEHASDSAQWAHDVDSPYCIDLIPSTIDTAVSPFTEFPGEVVELVTGWGIDVAADGPGVWTVSAAHVDFDAKWKRNKYGNPNRVSVTGNFDLSPDPLTVTLDSADGSTSESVVELALESTFKTSAGALQMARMYLPDSDARDRWQADAFRFYAANDLDKLTPSWFPNHADPTDETIPYRGMVYARPVIVHDLDPARTPTGKGFHAGQLASVVLAYDSGDPVVDFQLRRTLPQAEPGGGGFTVADWLDVPHADPDGPTVAELDPRFTVYDYRLAREA